MKRKDGSVSQNPGRRGCGSPVYPVVEALGGGCAWNTTQPDRTFSGRAGRSPEKIHLVGTIKKRIELGKGYFNRNTGLNLGKGIFAFIISLLSQRSVLSVPPLSKCGMGRPVRQECSQGAWGSVQVDYAWDLFGRAQADERTAQRE